MSPKRFFLLMLIYMSLAPPISHGRSDDTRLPLHIEADTAEFDDNTGISIYLGKVRITQGTMVLTGNKITVFTADKQLHKITAEGQPSTFQQTTDEDEQIDAEALYMEYNTKTNMITLKKKAKMTQDNNSFSAELIEFHILTKVVDAGDPKSGGRVKMVIIPDSID
ncbi:MAG: lipopolysaccharide transport periplasmic protein LptA [Gammaproteobacteria bacterium]|nr:lipopolysaccharide transport periplasmic protein LptA [Gammaproteobacteria bacterium]